MTRGHLRAAGPLVLVLALLALPSVAAAAQRYASPGGGGTACTALTPCSLVTAVNSGASVDEVIINPGDYGSAMAPLTTELVPNPRNVHGAAGRPLPRVFSSADSAFRLGTGRSISRVHIVHSGDNAALSLSGNAIADTVISHSSGTGTFSTACSAFGGTFRSVLCHTTAAGKSAFNEFTAGADPATITMRNVTAVAEGAGAYGVALHADTTQLTINATNVIAQGTAADVRSETSGSAGTTAAVNLRFSNFSSTDTVGTGATATALGEPTNQTAAPLLTGANFQQAPGSPTIDKGVTEAGNAATDYEGQARAQGKGTDIGADEVNIPKPAVPPAPADKSAPRIRGLAFSRSAFAAASKGASIAARKRGGRRRVPVGTTVSYRLTEAATVRFTVQRARKGRKVGRRCRRPTRRNRARRRCTRYVRVRGSFSHQGKAGTNSFRFTGRLRGRKLRRGRYKLVGVATDAAGNRGARLAKRFRIVRR